MNVEMSISLFMVHPTSLLTSNVLKLSFNLWPPDFHTDFQENFTIQLSGTKKWIFRESTAVAPLRGCTPHFKALGKDKSSSSSSILGFDQTATDLNEQQIKVLRLGDSSFSARQYVDAAAKGEDDARKAGQEHFVVLGPGDVMYHPAGTIQL